MIADRLQKGDEIRVIAPSRSLSVVRKKVFKEALNHLQSQGYSITFSKHSSEVEYADSASIQVRVEDLHEAFLDPNVKAILTAIGGFSPNQILEYIDYSLIQKNPKIICGFSDATALLNAIYGKTELITYHGPFFCSFGMRDGRAYTEASFEKCVIHREAYHITPSAEAGHYYVIREGSCTGTVIGGNLCTLNLLQGTEFMPKLKDVILFLEDDNIMGDYFLPEFERNLQSLLQVQHSRISGIVFGRFAEECKLTPEKVAQIVKNKRKIRDIPVIFNADFGHVFPFATFPIGGKAQITAKGDQAEIVIQEH